MKKTALIIGLMACHLSWAQAPAAQTTAATTTAAPTTSLTENQIAKVLVTINEGEIDAAKMAMKKAQAADVKNFAKMMMETHKTNESETKKLAHKNKMSMANSDLAKDLNEEAKKLNKDLKKSDKSAFDQAYISEQVTMHEKALKTLDETLIPNAKTPDLVQHLQRTRVAVSEHLNHAKGLQASSTR
jgi:putative membrane protein